MVVLSEIDFNITIVGLGLIGGSFAMALKELNIKNLWAVDIDTNVIKTAEDMGIIDKGYTDPETPLQNSDIVIICLYPNLTLEFIKENMDSFKPGTIITDTAGIKERLIKEVDLVLRKDIEFIGGHPMAGREYKGFEFASKEIFKGANYIITPTNKNSRGNIEKIELLIRRIGFKRIIKITPQKHDEIIAYTSQLPHIMATALINSDEECDTNSFVGGSFKDATRVARINCDLWTELLINNGENVLAQIESFEKRLGDIKRAIIDNERDALKALFEKGSLKREELI